MSKSKQKFYSYLCSLLVICIASLFILSILELANTNKVSTVHPVVQRNSEADLLLTQGLKYLSEKRNLKAEEVFKQAIAVNPSLAEAYNNLGIIYYQQRADRKAIESFEKALAINSNYHVAYYNLIWLLHNHQYFAQWQKAIQQKYSYATSNSPPEYSFALIASKFNDYDVSYITKIFRAIVEQEPKEARFHWNLGLILEIQGNVRQAISEYKKAIKLDPALSQPYYRLGFVYRNIGKNKQAIAYLLQAKERYIKNSTAYGFWRTNQLISLINNNSLTENLDKYNSSQLIQTDFIEDRKILSRDEIYNSVSSATVCIVPKDSFSSSLIALSCKSGINLTEDGYIVTSVVNVNQSDRVMVTFKNGQQFTGEVLARGSSVYLALIKLDNANNLPTATWASKKDEKRNSDLSLANSNTVYGIKSGATWQMTQGRIIKFMRSQSYYRLPAKSRFETSKDFSTRGYSGSPLINSYGQVIGITFATKKRTQEGLHYSVSAVKDFIDRIVPAEIIKRDFESKSYQLRLEIKK